MSFISKPDVTFNIVANSEDVSNAPQKILFIGQGTDGTAVADKWSQNVGSSGQEDTLFGKKTMLATMIREFRKINSISQIDAVNIAEPITSAAKATATVIFAGVSTEAGNIEIAIQSEKLHKYTVPVPTGSTAATIASSLNTLVGADTTILVTTSVASETVTLTAVHSGEEYNSTSIRVISNVAGITTTISPFTGGAGNITVPDLDSLIGKVRYQTIIYPVTYGIDTIKTYLDSRFNATNIVLDGVAIVTKTDTAANLQTTSSVTNSSSIVLFGNKTVSQDDLKGGAIIEMNVVQSSYIAAIRSLRLTDGSNIAAYLVGGSITNSFGGAYMAATPYHNTPISMIATIVNNYGWSFSEQKNLVDSGVSVVGNNTSITSIIMSDIVTTYLTNVAGLPDDSFKYLNYVDTASNIREYFFNSNKKQYAQTSLTNGDLIQGIRMANADSIKNYQFSLYETLSGTGYGLTQAGTTAFSYFKNNLSVTISTETGTANISMIVPIVTQLRAINGTVQIGFEI